MEGQARPHNSPGRVMQTEQAPATNPAGPQGNDRAGRVGLDAQVVCYLEGAQVITWSAQVSRVALVPVGALADGSVIDDPAPCRKAARGWHCRARVAALPAEARLLQLALHVREAEAGDWRGLGVSVRREPGCQQCQTGKTRGVGSAADR